MLDIKRINREKDFVSYSGKINLFYFIREGSNGEFIVTVYKSNIKYMQNKSESYISGSISGAFAVIEALESGKSI